MDKIKQNEKQLLYYHKFKKQLKYYYDNREKRLDYMRQYRNKFKKPIANNDVKIKIQYGNFILYFD